MFPMDLFLTNYGYSAEFMNVFEFAKKYQEQLIEVIRIDEFHNGTSEGKILGNHIFYLIFADSKSLCKFLVFGCGATSGYEGSGPSDFKNLMDWISVKEIEISYYTIHPYEEHFKFWGSELDTYGQNVPSQKGQHRKYGPSPWDYGDRFVQQASRISKDEYNGLSRSFDGAKQQLYSNTFNFLLSIVDSGDYLRFL